MLRVDRLRAGEAAAGGWIAGAGDTGTGVNWILRGTTFGSLVGVVRFMAASRMGYRLCFDWLLSAIGSLNLTVFGVAEDVDGPVTHGA